MGETIAVLITCYNRKAMPLECLDLLFQQKIPTGYSLAVYLVDDGCSDGTRVAVQAAYPEVNLITGDGSLYWSAVVFQALHSVRLDRPSDRSHSAGVQDCRDRLVVGVRSEHRAEGRGGSGRWVNRRFRGKLVN